MQSGRGFHLAVGGLLLMCLGLYFAAQAALASLMSSGFGKAVNDAAAIQRHLVSSGEVEQAKVVVGQRQQAGTNSHFIRINAVPRNRSEPPATVVAGWPASSSTATLAQTRWTVWM